MSAKPQAPAGPEGTGPGAGFLPAQAKGPAVFFLLAAFVFLVGSQVHPLADADAFTHMRDGRYWTEHGLRFGPDPFTDSIPGKSIDKIEVLFCLGIYQVWRIGGANALIAAKALLVALTFVLLGWQMVRRWPHPGVAGGLLLLGLCLPSSWGMFRERPYLFTYLLLALCALWLERYRSVDADAEPRARRVWWWLPPLTILWANLHPGFIVVFGFLGAQWVEDAIRVWRANDPLAARRCRVIGLTMLAVFAAGALNPLGFGIYTYAVQHTGSALFNQHISEWASPSLDKNWDVYLFLGGIWLSQVAAAKEARVADWLTLAIFSYMACTSYRNFPLALIAGLPVLAGNLRALTARWFPALRLRPRMERRAYVAGGAAALVVLGAMSLSPVRILHAGMIQNYYPEDAVTWIQGQSLAGRMVEPIHWADYVSWRTNGGTKVFMDGRLMLFGEKLFADLIRMSTDVPELLPTLDRQHIEVLMAEMNYPEGYFRRLTAGNVWSLVYFDRLSCIFARTQGLQPGWVRQHAYRRIFPWQKSELPFDSSDLEAAQTEAERAARENPRSPLAWHILGQIRIGLGARDKAIEAFAAAVALDPAQAAAEFNWGLLLVEGGNRQAGRDHLEAAIRHSSNPAERAQMIRALEEIPESGREP